jgi:hypothetical protein
VVERIERTSDGSDAVSTRSGQKPLRLLEEFE